MDRVWCSLVVPSTCGTLELAVTLPSFLRSSSSSCMDIFVLVWGMLKVELVAAEAFADISVLSLAFCCRYCNVCKKCS